MDQAKQQQLQIQGGMDSLRQLVNFLTEDKMNLTATNYVLNAQLSEVQAELKTLKDKEAVLQVPAQPAPAA